MIPNFDLPSALTGAQRKVCDRFLTHSYWNHDSYERLPGLLTSHLESDVFYAALGYLWSDCDNISKSKSILEVAFAGASRRQFNLMMDDAELAKWKRLPSEIIAYRFCYSNNRDGFSFSLRRSVALSFAFCHRYTREDDKTASILAVSIPRRWTVLKLGREESEVIITHPHKAKRIRMQTLKRPMGYGNKATVQQRGSLGTKSNI